MKEISLKISEILQLEIELNGLRSQEGTSVFNGILNAKLPLVAKYWISELNEGVTKEKTKVEELRNELIKKYGTTDKAGNVSIELFTDKKKTIKNLEYSKFEAEYTTLLNETKIISYTPIKLSLIENVETGENYTMFYKFIEP